MSHFVIAALYRFISLPNFKDLQQPILNACLDNEVKGTLLLAHEGINGTIAGSREGIDQVLDFLRNDCQLDGFDHKESYEEVLPFYRMKVKLKKEIVTMGVDDIDPNQSVGTYLNPKEWNTLIQDPEVTLIDTRNNYEYGIGTFKGAIDPVTETFREFPDYVKQNMDPAKHKKVAMFCTGGIRCEKSTAFMKQQGFEEVYHLRGGILKYLEEIPEEESLWQGECFVFDNRVAVNHQLEKGQYDQCHGCRYPITDQDKLSEKYIKGVSCPRCYEQQTPEQRERFMERQKQIELAKARNVPHIGSAPPKRQFKVTP